MTAIDIDHLRGWIGREETNSDRITRGLVQRFNATLGPAGFNSPDSAPLAIHWCLAPAAVPLDEIGEDGHPERGGFLPPVSLPRRMWAGGRLEFHEPLRPDDEVTRVSRIADVTGKTGRSGQLVFVTVEHEIATARGVAVSERQDIVYRGAQLAETGRPAPSPDSGNSVKTPDHSETVDASTVLLFRYSALTFNSHRIHYDGDYASNVEGYPGLVVHGPLQATLLLHFAARLNDGKTPRRFDYRGVSPLFHGSTFSRNAVKMSDGFELWTANSSGTTTLTASATW